MIRIVLIILTCICLILIPLTSCDKSTTSNDNGAIYQDAIKTARTEISKALLSGSTNATVAIMDNGKIVYSEAFGMRDIENSIPVDNNTQFNIGSGSKVFTATAIMLLCDQGKIELDKPVTTYLPEFKMKDDRYKNITIRMLLNHSSGFPGCNFKESFTSNKNRNYIQQTLCLLAESNLKSNPGEISVYCNDGFTVAEAVIEKVSGISYSDFIDKNIFSKLNMQNSSAYFKDNNSNIALTFDTSTVTSKSIEYLNCLGAGGLSSTAEDLCKFGSAFYYDSQFFQPKSLAEFLKPQYGSNTVSSGTPYYQFGLGWDTVAVDEFNKQNIQILQKSGTTMQYHSSYYIAPKEKLNISMIFGGSASPDTISVKIMQSLLESKGIVKHIQNKKTLPLKSIPLPKDILSYKGFYYRDTQLVKVDFDMQKNTLDTYTLTNGAFVKAASFPYKEDGYFYLTDTKKINFSMNHDIKVINTYIDESTSIYNMSLGESTKEIKNTPQQSLFDNKFWICHTMSTYDEYASILGSTCKTVRCNDLPNHILYDTGSGYCPAELVDQNNAKMTLKFARDLFEPKIVIDNGVEVLKMGNYEFIDASKLDVLAPNTKITIGQYGYNEARLVNKDTIFNSTISRNSRIIVLSSTGTVSYDSLFNGISEILINAGSYVVFIGDAGTTFAPQITQ